MYYIVHINQVRVSVGDIYQSFAVFKRKFDNLKKSNFTVSDSDFGSTKVFWSKRKINFRGFSSVLWGLNHCRKHFLISTSYSVTNFNRVLCWVDNIEFAFLISHYFYELRTFSLFNVDACFRH